jgi:hypothetical protein
MQTITYWEIDNTMKTDLIRLEMMKTLLHKKLSEVEKQINQLKVENTNE